MFDVEKLGEVISGFSGRRVAVFGDLMLDEYIFGDANRISPEAPVPVVLAERKTDVPGGAANVANNISALGGIPIVSGIIGEDDVGGRLQGVLAERGIDGRHLVVSPARKTTLKIRVIAHNQQIVRIDEETTGEPNREELDRLSEALKWVLSDVHILVISDYGKGAVNAETVGILFELAERNSIPVVVDPKTSDYSHFKGCKVLTPNHKEAGRVVGRTIRTEEDLRWVGGKLLAEVGCEGVLITWGERGMALFEGRDPFTHLPTEAREVYDVTGAGDTVVATLVLALAAGADLLSAAYLANLAAGIVVGKMGTSTVNGEELTERLTGLDRKGGR